MMLSTLRSRLLLIPGQLVRSGNKSILKLPVNFLYKDVFDHAIRKIETITN